MKLNGKISLIQQRSIQRRCRVVRMKQTGHAYSGSSRVRWTDGRRDASGSTQPRQCNGVTREGAGVKFTDSGPNQVDRSGALSSVRETCDDDEGDAETRLINHPAVSLNQQHAASQPRSSHRHTGSLSRSVLPPSIPFTAYFFPATFCRAH